MSNATTLVGASDDEDGDDPGSVLRRAWLPEGVRLIEVRGPLFFGGADQLRSMLDVLPNPSRVLLIDLEATTGLDSTTTRILVDFANRGKKHGSRVIFITQDPQAATTLRRAGLERALTAERAVQRIRSLGVGR